MTWEIITISALAGALASALCWGSWLSRRARYYREMYEEMLGAFEQEAKHARTADRANLQLQIARDDLAKENLQLVKLKEEMRDENQRLAELIEIDGVIRKAKVFDAYSPHVAHSRVEPSHERVTTFRVQPKEAWAFSFVEPWDTGRADKEWPLTAVTMARRYAREAYDATVQDWEDQIANTLCANNPHHKGR